MLLLERVDERGQTVGVDDLSRKVDLYVPALAAVAEIGGSDPLVLAWPDRLLEARAHLGL